MEFPSKLARPFIILHDHSFRGRCSLILHRDRPMERPPTLLGFFKIWCLQWSSEIAYQRALYRIGWMQILVAEREKYPHSDPNKKWTTGLILSNKHFRFYLYIIWIWIFESFMAFSTNHIEKQQNFSNLPMRNLIFFAGFGLSLADKILHMPLDERNGPFGVYDGTLVQFWKNPPELNDYLVTIERFTTRNAFLNLAKATPFEIVTQVSLSWTVRVSRTGTKWKLSQVTYYQERRLILTITVSENGWLRRVSF